MDYLQYNKVHISNNVMNSFKPCYKWITFNTQMGYRKSYKFYSCVLNLVINGLPSIQNSGDVWDRCN